MQQWVLPERIAVRLEVEDASLAVPRRLCGPDHRFIFSRGLCF
jgi:hypothetical protein